MNWSLGLPELVIVLFIVVLIVGAKRLPRLGESLSRSVRSFQEGRLDEWPEYPVDACSECRRETGLRCRRCRRFTERGGYLLMGLLAVVAVALVAWHVLVPVL